jgi:hypothetical protein
MKRLLSIIFPLLLTIGSSKSIDESTLINKSGVNYSPDSNKPYTGEVFINYSTGELLYQGTYKDGIRVQHQYYERYGGIKLPINIDFCLNTRDNRYFTKDTNEPYYGNVFLLDPSGNDEIIGEMKEGKFIVFSKLYEDGRVYVKGQLRKGTLVDKWTWFSEEGNKKEEWSFHKDLNNSWSPESVNFKTYHDNGKVYIEGSFSGSTRNYGGIRFGNWKQKNNEGKLLKENSYSWTSVDGYIKSYHSNIWKVFDENGNIEHYHEYGDKGENNKSQIKSTNCGLLYNICNDSYYYDKFDDFDESKIEYKIPDELELFSR